MSEEKETQQFETSAGPIVPVAKASLEVPGYPYKIEISVQLTEDLQNEIRKNLDERERNVLCSNVVFNMLFAALGSAMDSEQQKSSLVLP